MERLIALVLAAGVGAYAAGSLDAQAAFDDVISDQLDAFKDRDIAGAFEFASPTIKGIFGNPQNFCMMVQRSFPMIWDNATARYLPQREEGGAILQRVIVTDKDGVSHVFCSATTTLAGSDNQLVRWI